jgi:hypothetical protein
MLLTHPVDNPTSTLKALGLAVTQATNQVRANLRADEECCVDNPALEYPRFIEGERRAPPEDVGSTSGFEEFLKAMAKPRHQQHREFAHWYGGRFDPVDTSVDIIRARLAKLARRRTVGKAAFAKSQNQQH